MFPVRHAVAALAILAAVAAGCSNDDGEAATSKTTTSTTAAQSTTSQAPASACEAFKTGDRIPSDVLQAAAMCVTSFDCADGRIHLEADAAGGKALEGFAPTDQSGNLRADTSDAIWRDRGPEYDGTGRTKLQFDCGG